MSKSLMCVRALYQVEDKFEVPEWLDLDNKEQVSSYAVDDHVLTVKLTDGKEIKIDPIEEKLRMYNHEPFEIIHEEDDEANDRRKEEEEEDEDEDEEDAREEAYQQGLALYRDQQGWTAEEYELMPDDAEEAVGWGGDEEEPEQTDLFAELMVSCKE